MAGSQITTSVRSATLADVIERILDKGLVIAGDIKIKLVDIELLTIQIRLLVASVDKAKELGIDWWRTSSFLSPTAMLSNEAGADVAALQNRVKDLEAKLASVMGSPVVPTGLPGLVP